MKKEESMKKGVVIKNITKLELPHQQEFNLHYFLLFIP